jgi:predicted Zn finger-like uncharacterized protein
MEIVCKNCNTSHYLSDERIPLETKTGKCKQCSAPITVLGKNALGSIELSLTQSTPPEPEATKNCDFCGEKILAIAKKCRHCGSMLDGSHAANSQSAIEPDIKPAEKITPPRTDDFVDNTLSYKVDSAIKKAVNTVMTRLTTFYSSYRTKNNTHNQQKITETLKKFAWLESVKNHSLKSKIIYIAVFVVSLITAIEIGWSNLLAILFSLLLVLWIVALFKPRVVLADTRRSASVRIAPVLFVLFIMMAVSQPPRNGGGLDKLMNQLNQEVAVTKNPRYTPIQIKFGAFGYINTEGKVVIAPQFLVAEIFTDDGLAKVMFGNTRERGFINKKGELIINLTGLISDDRIDLEIGDFSNGLAWIRTKDGKYGYINTEGKMVIEPYKFNKVGDFSKNGLARVSLENNKYGYINRKGDLILNFDRGNWSDFGGSNFSDNGLARVYGHGSSSFERVVLQEGLGASRINDKGFINEKGDVVIKEDNYLIEGDFSKNGLARITVDKKYGYINSEGDIVIKPEFKYAKDFANNGLASVEVVEYDKYGASKTKYGYIDSQGEIVIKPQFISAESFSNGLAKVQTENEYGYINESGVYFSKDDLDYNLTHYNPQKIEPPVTIAPQPVAEVATPEPVLNNSPASSEPQKIETPVTVAPEVATPEQVETPIVTESQPVAEVATPTPATTTTPEMLELARYKAKEAIEEANKQINVVWQGTSKETRKNLLPEQREWLKKRENDCDAKAKSEEANNAIIQETIKFNCMAEMTIKRTDELEKEIDVLVGD